MLGLIGWCVVYLSQPYNLARSYQTGFLLPLDRTAALKWYVRAAEEGDTDAALQAAFLYAPAGGAPRDEVNALKWLRFAADRGNFSAQMTLGNYYLTGQGGVPVDKEEGYYWQMIGQGADPNSWAYKTARQALTDEQLERAVKRAKEWKPVKDK
jgi:hypothetical protein